MADIIAVTGATGSIGGRVARQLAAGGANQRLVVRDPSRAPALDGVEVAVATYDDPDALRRGFEGVTTLLFVSAAENEHRIDQHFRVVDAAADAGVEHVVYTSFLGASADCTFTLGRDHFRTEERIKERGLRHTFLRDSLYLDFLPFFAGEGEIRAPAGDGRFSPVARRDVARVAAVVLGDADRHIDRTYNLTGPDLVTMREAAALLSEVTGRLVPYIPETLDEAYASRAKYGAPDWEVRGWVTSYAAIAEGELDLVSRDVEAVTGAAPIGIREWLSTHPDAWAHLME